MATGQFGAAMRQFHRIFGAGTVSGLTESQLLERFVARRDESAFEALVARHGPMVLGVCRRLLDDPNDVEDAFQATFLVLVRKAPTIRDRELLANWLYGVAHRVAARARADASRRRSREKGGIELAAGPEDEAVFDDLGPVLHEEVRRLPEKYRAPVVLCYLQGRTHEEAAQELQWPIGTVKGRLARARDQLRRSLSRRGVAVPAGLLAAALARDARAAVPMALHDSTVKAALGFAAGRAVAAGLGSAGAIALAEGVLKTMLTTKLKVLGIGALTVALLGGGTGTFAYQFGGIGGGGQIGAAGARKKARLRAKQAATKPAPAQPSQPEAAAAKQQAGETAAVKEARSDVTRAWVEVARENLKNAIQVAPNQTHQAFRTAALQVMSDLRSSVGNRPADQVAAAEGFLAVVEDLAKEAEESIDQLGNQAGGANIGVQSPKGFKAAYELLRAQAKLWLAEAKAGPAEPQPQPIEPQPEPVEPQPEAPAAQPAAPADTGPESEPDLDATKTQAILRELNKPIAMPFAEATPLEDVLKYLKQATTAPDLPDGIPIYLDPSIFREHTEQQFNGPMMQVPGLKKEEAKVTINLEGVRLRTALRLMLNQLHLAYRVKEGLLIISYPGSPEIGFVGMGMGGMGMGGMGGMGGGMR